MKKISLLALLSCAIIFGAIAQCTPNSATGEAGLTPRWQSPDFDCIVPGSAYAETIYFENFTSVSGLTINSLRLDSIAPIYVGGVAEANTGIPGGLTYVTNLGAPPVTWQSGETGCISIDGTADAGLAIANWQIGIYVTMDVVGLGSISGEAGELAAQFNAGDFSFFLKVRDSATPCDSLVGINELTTISKLNVAPNPFSSTAVVTFNSQIGGTYTAIMTDVVGKEVSAVELEITNGFNRVDIERGNLTSGVYFYTITNGTQTITKRLLIQD